MIKRLIFYPLLILFTITYGKVSVVKKFDSIHKDFNPYVNEFSELTNRSQGNLTVGFSELEDSTIGICQLLITEIIIDPIYWASASRLQRKALIYHESCHCLSLEYHSDPNITLVDGCPLSIMNPSSLSNYCLSRHFTWYFEMDIKLRCRR